MRRRGEDWIKSGSNTNEQTMNDFNACIAGSSQFQFYFFNGFSQIFIRFLLPSIHLRVWVRWKLLNMIFQKQNQRNEQQQQSTFIEGASLLLFVRGLWNGNNSIIQMDDFCCWQKPSSLSAMHFTIISRESTTIEWRSNPPNNMSAETILVSCFCGFLLTIEIKSRFFPSGN